MNKNIIQGEWKNIRGKAKEKWGELSDDDLDRIEGKRDQLEGMLQKKYGYAQDEAKKHVDEFERDCAR